MADFYSSHSDLFVFFFFFGRESVSLCSSSPSLCPELILSSLSCSPALGAAPPPQGPAPAGGPHAPELAGGRCMSVSLILPSGLTPVESTCCFRVRRTLQTRQPITMPRRSSNKATLRMDTQGRWGTWQPEASSAIMILCKHFISCVAGWRVCRGRKREGTSALMQLRALCLPEPARDQPCPTLGMSGKGRDQTQFHSAGNSPPASAGPQSAE